MRDACCAGMRPWLIIVDITTSGGRACISTVHRTWVTLNHVVHSTVCELEKNDLNNMIETARPRPLGSPAAPRPGPHCTHPHTTHRTHAHPARLHHPHAHSTHRHGRDAPARAQGQAAGGPRTHAGTATEPHSAQKSEVHSTAREPRTHAEN